MRETLIDLNFIGVSPPLKAILAVPSPANGKGFKQFTFEVENEV